MFPLQEPLYFPLELSKNSERWNFPKLELSPRSSLKQQNSGGGSRAGEEVRHKFGENPPKKAPGEEKDCERRPSAAFQDGPGTDGCHVNSSS